MARRENPLAQAVLQEGGAGAVVHWRAPVDPASFSTKGAGSGAKTYTCEIVVVGRCRRGRPRRRLEGFTPIGPGTPPTCQG